MIYLKNIFLQSIILASCLDHQEHNCIFWAQLPLKICRHFHIQEIMTGLCVGDLNISKINRNGV